MNGGGKQKTKQSNQIENNAPGLRIERPNEISTETKSSNELLFLEQKQFGLYYLPICPVCYEIDSRFTYHLRVTHGWSKNSVDGFLQQFPSVWKCTFCQNRHFNNGFHFQLHLQQDHCCNDAEANQIVQNIYNEKKARKFCHHLLFDLFCFVFVVDFEFSQLLKQK